MKTRMFSALLLMLVGTCAHAAGVVVGNGIYWTTAIDGIGTDMGTITLKADVSGSTLGPDVYLAGIGIKNLGESDTSPYKVTSISLTNWLANNDELNASSTACFGGADTADKRACAYAPTLADRASGAGDLTIVLGVKFDSGVISDTFHFKVRWEDLQGQKVGDLISQDLSVVPLPAAVWLFGSALLGLTLVARRKDPESADLA